MELDFSNHLSAPFHFEIPSFHSASSTVELEQRKVRLFISFSKNDFVEGCFFHFEGEPKNFYFTAFYSFFCKWIEGKKIGEIKNFSYPDSWNHPFLNIPLIQFRSALRSFRGLTDPSLDFFPDRQGHLVCRCFGVSEERIVLFKKNNPQAKLSDVMGNLLAGAGCGSCALDIEEILRQGEHDEPNLMLYNTATCSEMILKIDELMNTFFQDRAEKKWEIISLRAMDLTLSGDDTRTEDFDAFRNYLFSELGLEFRILSLGSTT